jgi:8-oxo-dGTP pyrophosphatase MutT (NUDIX family)/phosphohistidine phosphatase SixA
MCAMGTPPLSRPTAPGAHPGNGAGSEAGGHDVVAAGAVVVRKGPAGREVLLVHRPKYDDWSFPKGKQDPGEHVTTTAVREVLEETGVEVRLGRPLLPQLYAVSGGRTKRVHYWVGHVVGDDDVSTYEPNAEVDALGWHPLEEAARRLTYLDDLHLLEQLREEPRPTSALIVVRHAKATKRRDWDGPDPRRPLLDVGREQARELARLLAAFGVTRVHSSSSTRCTQTLAPYAEEQVLPLEELDELSEELSDSGAAARLLHTLAQAPESSVVCSHRPVLPGLLTMLGVREEPLAPSELVVCHHRKGVLVATERHLPGHVG